VSIPSQSYARALPFTHVSAQRSRLLIRSRRPSSTIIGERIIEGIFPRLSSGRSSWTGIPRSFQSFSSSMPRSGTCSGSHASHGSRRAMNRAMGLMLDVGMSWSHPEGPLRAFAAPTVAATTFTSARIATDFESTGAMYRASAVRSL
jgi:hypothetical protein